MSAIHISNMTGKLEGFHAISSNTLSNPFCVKMNAAKKETICSHCYSHNMLKSYRKNMQPCLQRNSDLLSSRKLLPSELPIILDAFFRFNAHGELINKRHLLNLVAVVNHNPHCTFAIWTKRKDIVKKVFASRTLPENLILVYSNPKLNAVLDNPPPLFHKTFNNVDVDNMSERQNCTGQKCKDCLLCYKFNTTDTIIEKVK